MPRHFPSPATDRVRRAADGVDGPATSSSRAASSARVSPATARMIAAESRSSSPRARATSVSSASRKATLPTRTTLVMAPGPVRRRSRRRGCRRRRGGHRSSAASDPHRRRASRLRAAPLACASAPSARLRNDSASSRASSSAPARHRDDAGIADRMALELAAESLEELARIDASEPGRTTAKRPPPSRKA